MSNRNFFDERFDRVSKSREQVEHHRSELLKGVIELNEAKKTYNSRGKELTESEVEVANLKAQNHDLKEALMKALIEKEELLTKKKNLANNIERLEQQISEVDKETNLMISGQEIDQFCERFSTTNQLSLVSKIQDARCKLGNKFLT